jgi:dihydrofolate synthase/folylpolyglutamate synthase
VYLTAVAFFGKVAGMPSSTRTNSSGGKSSGGGKGRDSGAGGAGNAGSASSVRPLRPVARKPQVADVKAGSINNYATAMRWLMSHVDYERMRIVPYNNRTFSLERVRKILARLKNPHQQLQCVLVAGTKGKGSTCAMLASMLQACGYTVGLYCSPHLVDIRERITIDGRMISYPDMTSLLKRVAREERALGDNRLSYFEILTAVALRHFSDQAVDIAVLETGLGGRLDATNVVTPLVCGMTHISLDHTNILGNELEKIAREKAGIFKKGVPAVSVQQDARVESTLCEVAEASSAPLQFTGKEIEFSFRFESNRELGPHTRVCVSSETCRWDHLPVPLKGEHQAHNCGLALALLDKLRSSGFNLVEEQVIGGLAMTNLPGRMEIVHENPRVIVDGAHNAESIRALIRSLGAHISYDSLVLIFGCGQDKQYTAMLKEVALGADKIIFTRAKQNSRAMDPELLVSSFNELSGKMVQSAPDLREALRLAGRAVSREDLIVVTGSFYLVGEAKKAFADAAAKKR